MKKAKAKKEKRKMSFTKDQLGKVKETSLRDGYDLGWSDAVEELQRMVDDMKRNASSREYG